MTTSSFRVSISPGIKSLVSGEQDVEPQSRGGLRAGRLPLRGVSSPGHGRAARLCSPEAERSPAAAAGRQLGHRVTAFPPSFLRLSLRLQPVPDTATSPLWCLGSLMDGDGSVNGFRVSEVQLLFSPSFLLQPLSVYRGKVGTLSAWAGGLLEGTAARLALCLRAQPHRSGDSFIHTSLLVQTQCTSQKSNQKASPRQPFISGPPE